MDPQRAKELKSINITGLKHVAKELGITSLHRYSYANRDQLIEEIIQAESLILGPALTHERSLFDQLPPEIFQEIFKHLDVESQIDFLTVYPALRELVHLKLTGYYTVEMLDELAARIGRPVREVIDVSQIELVVGKKEHLPSRYVGIRQTRQVEYDGQIIISPNYPNLELRGIFTPLMQKLLPKYTDAISVDLNDNQLTEIPPTIFQMKELQSLSLQGNRLSKIPPELQNLPNLQQLSVDPHNYAEARALFPKELFPRLSITSRRWD